MQQITPHKLLSSVYEDIVEIEYYCTYIHAHTLAGSSNYGQGSPSFSLSKWMNSYLLHCSPFPVEAARNIPSQSDMSVWHTCKA